MRHTLITDSHTHNLLLCSSLAREAPSLSLCMLLRCAYSRHETRVTALWQLITFSEPSSGLKLVGWI